MPSINWHNNGVKRPFDVCKQETNLSFVIRINMLKRNFKHRTTSNNFQMNAHLDTPQSNTNRINFHQDKFTVMILRSSSAIANITQPKSIFLGKIFNHLSEQQVFQKQLLLSSKYNAVLLKKKHFFNIIVNGVKLTKETHKNHYER